MIKHKGNRSAPGLDKIIYPIFKYLPENQLICLKTLHGCLYIQENAPLTGKKEK
jgi:hypothetical protein